MLQSSKNAFSCVWFWNIPLILQVTQRASQVVLPLRDFLWKTSYILEAWVASSNLKLHEVTQTGLVGPQWLTGGNYCCLLFPVSGCMLLSLILCPATLTLFRPHLQARSVYWPGKNREDRSWEFQSDQHHWVSARVKRWLGSRGEKGAGVESRLVRSPPFWQQQADRFNCCM